MLRINVNALTTVATILKDMLSLHVHACMENEITIANADDGFLITAGFPNRHVLIVGHPIHETVARVTWINPTSESSWYEDITTHDVTSFKDVARAIVDFVGDGVWPTFCTAHKKSKPQVTSFKDDKPYSTVDLVVLISSSMETMTLYQEYVDWKWSYRQDMGGYMHTIGHINDRPICISPMIHTIAGLNVMYVEANSSLIDWEMIEDWVREVTGKPDIKIQNSPINFCGDILSMLNERKRMAVDKGAEIDL